MRVEVRSSARIHVNSIDMTGSSLRTVGGIGFRLKSPAVAVTAELGSASPGSPALQLSAPILRAIAELGLPPSFDMSVDASLPKHKGLGSETQTLLCLLQALHTLAGRAFTASDAFRYGVGRTSGVGVATFFNGGLVVEGGFRRLGSATQISGVNAVCPAPGLVAQPFPDEWRVLLAIPRARTSLSGPAESEFFQRVTPAPLAHAHEIAYQILLGVLPAVIERDFPAFLACLDRICKLGVKVEEERLNASLIARLLEALRSMLGFASVSSLGPSVYAFTQDAVDLNRLASEFDDFSFVITQVDNSPSAITVSESP